jgi:predicted nuclease of predicted toxin-antitoxin system
MLVGLDRAADSIVWQYARDHQYTIVTRDADFNYLLGLHGMPPKVIWIRRGNCKTNEIVDLLLAAADAIKAFEINPQLALLELY